ncbi:zinc-ribbon domain-containing protein [Streptomyces sp. NPDC003362]
MLSEVGLTGGWGKGIQSLAYLRPDLAAEYDDESNKGEAQPVFEVSVRSVQSVWWQCLRDERHRWKTSVHNRYVRGTGCPRSGKKGVSRREQEVFEALRQHLPDLVSPGTAARHATSGRAARRLRSWKVDMLLPGSRPVAVEYDGAYWHRDALERDQDKTADLIASGHRVIRIREKRLSAISLHDVLCTAEQPVQEVAEQVYQRILALTGPTDRRPSREPGPADGDQLNLFDDAGTRAAEGTGVSGALREVVGQLLLECHRCNIEWDLALGQSLVGALPLEVLCMQTSREARGLLALTSMAMRPSQGDLRALSAPSAGAWP